AGSPTVELGSRVQIGEERLEAGLLGPHLRAEAVVDLDGLGDDLPLALGRAPGPELLAQFVETVLGGHDRSDLVEVEAAEVLQLADASDPGDVVIRVPAGASRAVT